MVSSGSPAAAPYRPARTTTVRPRRGISSHDNPRPDSAGASTHSAALCRAGRLIGAHEPGRGRLRLGAGRAAAGDGGHPARQPRRAVGRVHRPVRGHGTRRGAPARLRLHRQGAFPRRQHRQTGRPAVHHRPASVPACGGFGAVRRGAHQGAGGAGRRRLRARPATGEDRGDAGARTRSAQGQPRHRPRAADGGRGGAAHGGAQPGMVGGPRADRRARVRPPRRSRQPRRRRPERCDAADHDRQPRSDLLRVRRIGGRLHPLHPAERRWAARVVARYAQSGEGAPGGRDDLGRTAA